MVGLLNDGVNLIYNARDAKDAKDASFDSIFIEKELL